MGIWVWDFTHIYHCIYESSQKFDINPCFGGKIVQYFRLFTSFLDEFWQRKLTLKVKFWHFLTARHYSNSPNLVISFDFSWFLAKNLSNFVSSTTGIAIVLVYKLLVYKLGVSFTLRFTIPAWCVYVCLKGSNAWCYFAIY